ncbi:MAG TPA: winged helix DNA-binding domain-containing protein [Micromonosporaceae bacterium]|nr:winged helix DNA-binding domain-containing protein [Micromonosporaceae bacterium]
MTAWDRVPRWRLARHLLVEPGDDLVAVARRVCGAHAQLAASAVAALDLRTAGGATAEAVDAALHRDRTLVKTWAARGTLHLLPAADLPLWVAAMSTRTRERQASWLRYQGLTAEQMTDLIAAAPDVLGAEPLTREELATALVKATGHDDLAGPLTQGFGMVLKPLAFRGLLCFGPPRGRNVTFVAPSAWLRGYRAGDPDDTDNTDDAIDALVLAHAGAYGPTDAEGFARWFDLKPSLAKRAYARLVEAGGLAPVGDLGFVPAELAGSLGRGAGRAVVRLLPAFDPYVVGSTRQLDRLMPADRKAEVSRPQGWISPTLVVDGRIAGVWQRENGGAVTVTPFAPLPRPVKTALTRLTPDVTVTD